MTLEDAIRRAKELIARREELDRELNELFSMNTVKRILRCSKCGIEGHTARTCTSPESPE
jgi:Zinc knuckle